MEEDENMREELFYSYVRDCVISFLLFTYLYIISDFVIRQFRRKPDIVFGDDEDETVDRIALWLCTFTLAVSLAAVLLLPFSIASNEVLLCFPCSYYMQWLNGSLVHGLWNVVFLSSNISLVLLMPFAYLFIESEGFSGSRKGIVGRLQETAVVLGLLGLLLLGIFFVAFALVNIATPFHDSYDFYFPYIYSCISLFGVLLLLLCTPLGLAKMFGVTGKLLVKPTLLEDVTEQIYCCRLDEAATQRQQQGYALCWTSPTKQVLLEHLVSIASSRQKLERRMRASGWQRNLCFPLAMLLLLLFTGILVLQVCVHILHLMVDDAAMPKGSKDLGFGKVSLSAFGSYGAALEVILIFYLMLSSLVGFYSLPRFDSLRPRRQNTPMSKVIGNCVVLLVLSSALPVLSRTLGITNFDLLGSFGQFDWLGNFHIVLLYNVLFASLSTLCLVRTFTASVRRELLRALGLARLTLATVPAASRKGSALCGDRTPRGPASFVHTPGVNSLLWRAAAGP
uniref:protein LMBR1L-like isoform X2 n=1 Tax=Myxine glutinosa TaxID=7769 RepID=UPI00358FD0BF